MKNPLENERIWVILGYAISSIAHAKHGCMGGWLKLWIWVIIGSGNGLLPDGIKPFTWTNIDLSSVRSNEAISLSHQSLIYWPWKLLNLDFPVLVELKILNSIGNSLEWCIFCVNYSTLTHQQYISAGVYTKISGRLSEEPFPWLIQKFPCILLFKTGQPGRQLNLSEGQIRLDLTSGRPLV